MARAPRLGGRKQHLKSQLKRALAEAQEPLKQPAGVSKEDKGNDQPFHDVKRFFGGDNVDVVMGGLESNLPMSEGAGDDDLVEDDEQDEGS
jgi:hypothetical protein